METIKSTIDPYLFEKQFEAFQKFVEEKSNVPFVSFASNPYTDEQEGYKYEIYRAARDKLAFQAWKESDIGSGDIIAATIESIEIKNNNLVQWQSRYGDEKRPHHPLYDAQKSPEKAKAIEQCLFRFYHKANVESSFDELVGIFGKKYALIAYLYFVKDNSKYLPIAPSYFDRAFELLGANFKTSKRCSWDNYSLYIDLISEIKRMLSEILSSDVSMLDAHSFAWMLSAQMESQGKLADVKEYLSLSDTERDAIIKSRIGQGQFRKSLISYWSTCAVTGCQEPKLLRASHIKPWSKSDVAERLSLYNGLLLSPTLDVCFDSGFISFDDSGNIMVSNELHDNDMEALGIHKEMKLSNIENEHCKYLAYHRGNIFKKS
jgi:predicted restriction endonuclease